MAQVSEFPTNDNGRLALEKAMSEDGALPKPETPLKDEYFVLLPNFEGPLDLLLHLIRKDQLNIYDIPIAHICRSYLEHLEIMKKIDVNLAGEFMVMAATLTLMKSLILLPREEGTSEEDDPRLPLVQQLLEYEKFKKAAEQIDARPWMGRDLYPRSPLAVQEVMPVESLIDGPIEPIDTFQLLLCLKIATDRTTRKPLQISIDTTSIKDKVEAVRNYLSMAEVMDFTLLLPEMRRPADIIVSFMAVLELAKLKYIEVIQLETFGPIQIRAVRSLQELNVALLDQY